MDATARLLGYTLLNTPYTGSLVCIEAASMENFLWIMVFDSVFFTL